MGKGECGVNFGWPSKEGEVVKGEKCIRKGVRGEGITGDRIHVKKMVRGEEKKSVFKRGQGRGVYKRKKQGRGHGKRESE